MVDRYKVVVGNLTATAHAAAHPDGQYVNWHEYEALRAEVEAHKRSRQIDASEARSREMELRAAIMKWREAPCHCSCPDCTELIDFADRLSSPTSAGPSLD